MARVVNKSLEVILDNGTKILLSDKEAKELYNALKSIYAYKEDPYYLDKYRLPMVNPTYTDPLNPNKVTC